MLLNVWKLDELMLNLCRLLLDELVLLKGARWPAPSDHALTPQTLKLGVTAHAVAHAVTRHSWVPVTLLVAGKPGHVSVHARPDRLRVPQAAAEAASRARTRKAQLRELRCL